MPLPSVIAATGCAPAMMGGGSALQSAFNALAATNAPHIYNPADQSTDSMSASRSTITQVAADGPIGQLFDLKGGLDFVAVSDAARPVATDGMTWDGVNHKMTAASWSPKPATATIMAIYKGADTFASIFGNNNDSTNFVLYANDFSGGATGQAAGVASGQSYIDSLANNPQNRGDLFTEMCDDAAHIVWHSGWSTAGTTTPGWSAWAAVEGILIPVAILNDGEADYTDQLSAAIAYANAIAGALGLGN